MNRQWTKVFFLLLNVTSMMTLVNVGLGVPVQALEAVSTDVVLLDANIAPMLTAASITPAKLLPITSWRSAGRGMPSRRVGGAGR